MSAHYRSVAVRGHLLEMAGDIDGALDQYRIAAKLTPSLPEQRYLTPAPRDSARASGKRPVSHASTHGGRLSEPLHQLPVRLARENKPHPPLTMWGGTGRPRTARDAGASSVVLPSDLAP